MLSCSEDAGFRNVLFSCCWCWSRLRLLLCCIIRLPSTRAAVLFTVSGGGLVIEKPIFFSVVLQRMLGRENSHHSYFKRWKCGTAAGAFWCPSLAFLYFFLTLCPNPTTTVKCLFLFLFKSSSVAHIQLRMLQKILDCLSQRLFGRTQCKPAQTQQSGDDDVTQNSRGPKAAPTNSPDTRATGRAGATPKKTTMLIMVAPPADLKQVGLKNKKSRCQTLLLWLFF